VQTTPGWQKRDLWIRLKHYHFNHIVPPHLLDHVAAVFGGADASTKAFASKLARKLKWPTRLALQAIEEYKKFIFLGMVSESAVTPPKVIDQVWHEHILFSRAYRDFCRDILGREFDHHPELIATDAQTSVFQSQYDATLALYEREFGYPPPAAIWGTPKFSRTADARTSKPTKTIDDRSTSSDDVPLYMFVGSSGHDGCGPHHGHGHSTSHHGDSGGHHSGDAGGHDAGAGAGDGGGGSDGGGAGCSGGSGCSSGCGGGGCSS